eukprot:1157862-Pelagomonas_calceolata.AAC.1
MPACATPGYSAHIARIARCLAIGNTMVFPVLLPQLPVLLSSCHPVLLLIDYPCIEDRCNLAHSGGARSYTPRWFSKGGHGGLAHNSGPPLGHSGFQESGGPHDIQECQVPGKANNAETALYARMPEASNINNVQAALHARMPEASNTNYAQATLHAGMPEASNTNNAKNEQTALQG